MRLLLTITFLILTASTVLAVDYRWTLISNEESSEATIDNGTKSSLMIDCSLPSKDLWGAPRHWFPSITLEPGTVVLRDGAKEAVVQFIVDGKIYPFMWDRKYHFVLSILAANKERDLHEFVTALASSNQQTFIMRFPKYKNSEKFSLLDARKVLGNGKDFILDRCENPPQK